MFVTPLAGECARPSRTKYTNCLIKKLVLVREGHALTALPYKEIHILCARAAHSPLPAVSIMQGQVLIGEEMVLDPNKHPEPFMRIHYGGQLQNWRQIE